MRVNSLYDKTLKILHKKNNRYSNQMQEKQTQDDFIEMDESQDAGPTGTQNSITSIFYLFF